MSTSVALRRRLVLAVPALLLSVALATPSTPAGAAIDGGAAVERIIDLEEEVTCEGTELDGNGQLTGPEATSTSHLLGDPAALSLDVLLVLDVAEAPAIARLDDGTEEGRAAYLAAGDEVYQEVLGLLEPSISSYEPLGITLSYGGWDLLAPLAEDGSDRVRTLESQEIIDLAKAQYGGTRPEAYDIVYVVSDLDIMALGTNAVAGQADCIGGVANPGNAFAVGEIRSELIPPEGLPIGPITFYKNYFAKIAAHEIGHLLGAHHHYQECATPGPLTSAVEQGENGPCSLMTNAVDFQTLPFGTLNSIVVRGHAEAFVTP